MLKGKVSLITGASSGVGKAVAKRMAYEGAHVFLVARNSQSLEATDDEIKKLGGEATLVELDLINYKKISELASAIYNKSKKLDILVSCAAIFDSLTLITDCEDSKWQEMIAVNLSANFHLIKNFDPLLKSAPNGRAIFLTSSLAAKENPSFWGPYAASKIALESLVRDYAAETSHTKIRVNMVNPGEINSRISKQIFPTKNITNLTNPDDMTDIFIKLGHDNCKFTGKIHYAQY